MATVNNPIILQSVYCEKAHCQLAMEEEEEEEDRGVEEIGE